MCQLITAASLSDAADALSETNDALTGEMKLK